MEFRTMTDAERINQLRAHAASDNVAIMEQRDYNRYLMCLINNQSRELHNLNAAILRKNRRIASLQAQLKDKAPRS